MILRKSLVIAGVLLMSFWLTTSISAFYNPAQGRWLSRDPIGETGGMNLYAFVGNNPVNWTDLWGLYVKGSFIRNPQFPLLILKDMDTGEIVMTTKVFSGNLQWANDPNSQHVKDHGPLPAGKYLLGNEYQDNDYCQGHPGGNCTWYKLYGSNGQGGYTWGGCIPVNDPTTGNDICRNEFYLHVGGASNGCVTVRSVIPRGMAGYPTSPVYDEIMRLLGNTQPFEYNGTTFLGIVNVY